MGNFWSMFELRERVTERDPHARLYTHDVMKTLIRLIEHHADNQEYRNRRRKERRTNDYRQLQDLRSMLQTYQESGDPTELVRALESMGLPGRISAADLQNGVCVSPQILSANESSD